LKELDDNLFAELTKFLYGVEASRSQRKIDEWTTIHRRVSIEIKGALDALEDEFRSLLGDR
jgi:hypothetical protein